MTLRYMRLTVLVALLAVTAWAGPNESLDRVYASILRGDYDASRAQADQLLQGAANDEIRAVVDWLESYHRVVASRAELKDKTFQWNVDQAKAILAESGKTYLALTFAAQAAAYAADPAAYAREPWVEELVARCRGEAERCVTQGHWLWAAQFYAPLLRLHEKDEALKERYEQALRHARIEALYEDEDALKEHIKDVSKDLLTRAVNDINRFYFEEPDLRKAAGGAIDNLIALCETPKIHEFLHGLANGALRDHFVEGLRQRKNELESRRQFGPDDLIGLYNQIWQLNRKSVELPEGLLVVEFMEGVRNELDDYTSIYWPAEAQAFDKSIMGGFEGVGIQLGLDEFSNRLKVITPLENSPALEAGVQPDDLIVAVDGESTKGWDTDDAVRKISGPAGTEVILTMFRPRTGDELAFKLTRRRIVQTSVRGVERIPGDANAWNYILDKDAGIAFIRMSGFLPTTHGELDRALADARRQGMQALILDVRHNPGGLLDVAIDAVSNFVAFGEVVATQGRYESEHLGRAAKRAAYTDIPLVVLVNEGSASGSEILAGALQDHERAIILGERTFGKGSVQHIRALGNDARLRLTTALYYLPSGRTPHKRPDADLWGVEPDWEVKLTPKEFRRVLEQQRDSYVIHNEEDRENKPLTDEEREQRLASYKDDEDNGDKESPTHLTAEDIKRLNADPHEAPNTDPQLETALLLLRVKLAANVPWPAELASAVKKHP